MYRIIDKQTALTSLKANSIPGGTSDENLVTLTAGGNAMAFKILVDRHSAYVTGIIARFLFNEEDTNELVQDTFIRVWKHLGAFDHRSLFTTWLYSIAFNLCLDRLRINRRRREVNLVEEAIGSYSGETGTIDQAERIDHESIVRAIREYAGSLSLVQRQVFVLRDLHDLTVEEVCQITGYDTDKVKSNLYHARKFIREKLMKGGYL